MSLSVVYSTRKYEQSYYEHILNTSGVKDIEIIPFENNGIFSLTEVYNKGIDKAKNNIVVFCHDDLIFEKSYWGKRLLEVFEKNKDYGIIGIAGTDHLIDGCWWTDKKSMHGIVNHTDGFRKWVSNFSKPQGTQVKEMIALDGLFFAIDKTKIKNRFDESFDGFHFYDISFCLANYLSGVKIGVITNLVITHKSVGPISQKWLNAKLKFEEKYLEKLPIRLNTKKGNPTIELHALCWNEEKIIPYFFNHYDDFVSKYYIYDNGSTDKSIELLEQNHKVTLIKYDTGNEIRDDVYLKIKNNKWKNTKSDIVIVCDMDEFIYHKNLKDVLIDFHESDTSIMKLTGFDMITDELVFDYTKKLTNLVRTGYPNKMFDKCLIFKPNLINDINYNYGCHVCNPTGSVLFYPNTVKLLHYKRLGLQYYLSKMKEYKQRLSEFNKINKLGFEYSHDDKQHIIDYTDCLDKKTEII